MDKSSLSFRIREKEPVDQSWLPDFIRTQWGEEFVIVHGICYFPAELQGFIAESDNAEVLGLLTYQISKGECEIVTLDSLKSGGGIGTALIEKMIRSAHEKNCSRVWLITTNDNLNALRFYQKRGFSLAKLFPGEVNRSRILKPSIPLLGEDGIPIRDEIELELYLHR